MTYVFKRRFDPRLLLPLSGLALLALVILVTNWFNPGHAAQPFPNFRAHLLDWLRHSASMIVVCMQWAILFFGQRNQQIVFSSEGMVLKGFLLSKKLCQFRWDEVEKIEAVRHGVFFACVFI